MWEPYLWPGAVWPFPERPDSHDGAPWRQIRRFAVPRSMIEECTRARQRGDWRAACEAGWVDVAFDLAEVGRTYGVEIVARLENDLLHLAADLVRWHIPRALPQQTIAPGLTCVLASYGDPAVDGPFLTVRTPTEVWAEQRLELGFGVPRVPVSDLVWWTGFRHLWDDRCVDELLVRCGGGARAPFFEADGTPYRPASGTEHNARVREGDPAARTEDVTMSLEFHAAQHSLAAAVVDLMPFTPGQPQSAWADDDDEDTQTILDAIFAGLPVAPTQWATALDALRPISEAWVIRLPDADLLLDSEVSGRVRCRVRLRELEGEDPGGDVDRLPSFPEAGWCRLPDLDRLVADSVLAGPFDAPEELHPLVRGALFPARQATGRPIGPPGPAQVRCGGQLHQLLLVDGELHTPAHSAEELAEDRRPRVPRVISGCYAAARLWGRGYEQAMWDELYGRALHGDSAGVEAVLDAGFDCTTPDEDGRTLLHYLPKLDHERLLPRLIAAGLDVTGHDREGRTPLQVAVAQRAAPSLLCALIEAGADPSEAPAETFRAGPTEQRRGVC